MEVAQLNRLRRSLKAAWGTSAERPTAQIHLVPDDRDHDETLDAFRTVASEMGIRHVQIDLSDGLTTEHIDTLRRQAPRLVVMTNIDRMPKEQRAGLHDAIAATARTLPIIIGFVAAGPKDHDSEPVE